MTYFLTLLTFFISLSLYARSGGAGNGGDVIVCPNREANKVMLLDFHEAQKWRFKISMVNPEDTTTVPTRRSMVNIVVNRVKKFDQVLAKKLHDYAMEMVRDFEKFEKDPDDRGDAVYIGNDVLAKINDSLHVSVPEDCEKEPRQLVIQKDPIFDFDFRYEFNKTYWEQMNLENQAMTILHEAWYRIMIENGATDSRRARGINALTASIQFEDFTFEQYLNAIQKTELKNYYILNNSLSIIDSMIKVDLKGEGQTQLSSEGFVCSKNVLIEPKIKETFRILNQSQEYIGKIRIKEICFENSRIRKLVFPEKLMSSGITLRLPFHQVEFSSASSTNPSFYYNEKGKLTHMTGVKAASIMEMFYRCNGRKSFTQNRGCEAGPYINHKSKISDPEEILFNRNEKLEPFASRRGF